MLFEMDAQLVVLSLQKLGDDLTEFGLLLNDCKALLKDYLNWLVQFVRR